MGEYITLLGAEDVQRAASRMQSAADNIRRAADQIDGALSNFSRELTTAIAAFSDLADAIRSAEKQPQVKPFWQTIRGRWSR